MAWDLLVRRDDLNTRRVTDAPDPGPLAPDSVCVRIDRFALTANNERERPPPGSGPAPTGFAPDRIGVRIREWGREVYEQRLADAWAAFVLSIARWLRLVHADGADAAERALAKLTDGSADPAEGIVVRPGAPA